MRNFQPELRLSRQQQTLHPATRGFGCAQNAVRYLATCAVALCLLAGCATSDPTTANGNQFGAVAYQVKQGDNLVLIAAEVTRNRDNWRLIADYNSIQNPATLNVGQRIWIPRDLIPLNRQETKSRSVAGHPDAVVNSVTRPDDVTPVTAE
jgi:hypothetical protein